MKSFTQIVMPHNDIIEGRLTMDVFAADLWQVANGNAPIDYGDSDLFFRKTYQTKGLKNIIDVAKKRLEGKSGDSVIQLQTPFGGGKTHTLIALYHKAKEWNANVVVFDGTAVSPKYVKPWEELERQITGKIEITKGNVAPGKEKLIKILSENSPVLILMDEVLEYITKAAGIKVGDSNLASQTFAFIQEITAAVSVVGNALLVLTLPSSILEHYDENAERMFQQLQKITGRTERIYAPVEDEEIESIVRARLFGKTDEKEIKDIVDTFVDYAQAEGLISGEEIATYRNRFLKSYPFKPEVIDILYKRWGSYPTFQRTRGVLRLLSLVVRDLLDKNIPFIRLGDFNLGNNEIKRELIKHIGPEWDSIIAQDITSKESGAKKVDKSLGASYAAYKLGTVVSTTIFMMSFSGKGEGGVGIREIKLSTAYPEFNASEIDNVINNLKEKLFYLSDKGLFFTNQPNLNRVVIEREESISEEDLREEEISIIKSHISQPSKFRIYIYPKFTNDIPDNPDYKLIILRKNKPNKDFLEKFGVSPRVYRNNLIFLCVDEAYEEGLNAFLKKLLALKLISEDKKLKLTKEQKKEIENKYKNHKDKEYEELRKFYRKVFVPAKNGYKEIDIGIPTYGETLLDREIYSALRNQNEILEKIAPAVIKERYLSGKDFVDIKKVYEALLKTPGEIRIFSKDGFSESIKEGVEKGAFGLGYIENENIKCKYINEKVPFVELAEGNLIIKPELCKEEISKAGGTVNPTPSDQKGESITNSKDGSTGVNPGESGSEEKNRYYSKIDLELSVPTDQISTIAKVVSFLNKNFSKCTVKVNIYSSDGKIPKSDYEDKILEALVQSKIEIEKSHKE